MCSPISYIDTNWGAERERERESDYIRLYHKNCRFWHTFVDPKVVVGPGCHGNFSIVGTLRDTNAKPIGQSFRG